MQTILSTEIRRYSYKSRSFNRRCSLCQNYNRSYVKFNSLLGTYRLRARWNPEMEQDMNAYHSLDIEQEITSLLSNEITEEIDDLYLDILNNANINSGE